MRKSNFWTLFKYEFKKTLPTRRRGKKSDITGTLISFFITLAIAVAFFFFLNVIAQSYVEVKINKISNPLARSAEFLNLLYSAAIAALSIMCLERIRKIISKDEEKLIFLRLPIKPEKIFLSKLSVLMLTNYAMSLVLLVPINLIVYIMLKPESSYWLYSAIVWILLPIVPMFIAAVLIYPYDKLIDYLKSKYALVFILVTGLLVGAFWAYSKVLLVIQSLLETGSIRFLFNEDFLTLVQKLYKYTYPANVFTDIALGINVLESVKTIAIFVLLSLVIVYTVTNDLFYSMLYKNESRKRGDRVIKTNKRLSPAVSLVKKEFISVFRDPGYMFSYFAIAAAMPMMVYCCYTLFESLLLNALGVSMSFSLALFIVLVFGVLTNTFCATNVTRDGPSVLTMKTFPLRPSRIMLAKVVFCMIVSSLSAVLSSGLLVYATSLTLLEGVVVALLGIVFATAQIFVATRLDLNNANLKSDKAEAEEAADKTVAKVIFIGLILSTVAGVFSLVASIFYGNEGGYVGILLSYGAPSVIAIGYLVASMVYYRRNIEDSFYSLVA